MPHIPRVHEVMAFVRHARGWRQVAEDFGLVVLYQPLVSADGRIVALEALSRCRRGPLASLPTSDFIAAMASSGRSRDLTRGVLEALCRQVRAWRLAGKPPRRLCMNVGAEELEAGFADDLISAVESHELAVDWLTLEITEIHPFRCKATARKEIEQLRCQGARIAIDDFGTGYSSIQRLLDIPVDEVKLDRSLVANISRSPRKARVVTALLSLLQCLGMSITAEGIEDRADFHWLSARGVRKFQGFYFGGPEPASRWDQSETKVRNLICVE